MNGLSPEILAGGVGLLVLKEAVVFIKWAIDKMRPENGGEKIFKLPYDGIAEKLDIITNRVSEGFTERKIIQTKLENLIHMVDKQNGDLKRTTERLTKLEAIVEKRL